MVGVGENVEDCEQPLIAIVDSRIELAIRLLEYIVFTLSDIETGIGNLAAAADVIRKLN